MKKSRHRPMINDTGEVTSRALYRVKKPAIKLKYKIILASAIIILVVIIVFFLWVLNERHRAEIKAKEANFNFAKILKEKARIYAKNQQWPLVKLFSVNSMLYQARARQFISMDDIKLPPELQHSELNYLTCLYRASYRVEEINRLLKEVEQKTGLVLDGTTPVGIDIYYSLDLDYYKNSSIYRSALEAYNTAEDFYALGTNELNQQHYTEAIAAFEKSLKIRPRFKEALNKLGWAYFLNGDKGKSKKIYKIAKKVDRDYYIKWNSTRWADWGDRQKKNDDYTNAIKSYKKAVEINSTYYRAWNLLGEAYSSENQFDKAIKVYKKARQALPHLPREWESKISYNQALKHYNNKQYQHAIISLRKAIDIYPQLDRAWLKLADAYQKQKGINVTYRGKPVDLYFNRTDLKRLLIFIARQIGVGVVIDPEVTGTITCQLDRVKWDKALELFLRLNDCDMVKTENIFIIGKSPFIERFLKAKAESDNKDKKAERFSGKPLDLSFFGADFHFVAQVIAARANLKIYTAQGINHSIICELSRMPWDRALDILLKVNDLSSFRLSNLIHIDKNDRLEKMYKNEEGVLEIFKSLLKLDPGQINFKDAKRKTLLFFAAEKGYARLTTFLISKGAKVNTRDKWNFTPLHEAANKAVAEVLINNGAFLNARSNSGFTPLHSAVYTLKIELARFLVSKGASSNIFLDASMGRFEQVRRQVVKKPDIVKNTTVGKWTLLHHAAAAGQYEICAFLISKNANLNAETLKSETPLHLAVSRGREKIVKLLVLNGANLNVRNKYGNTPLRIAKTNGNREVIKLLQKFGGLE